MMETMSDLYERFYRGHSAYSSGAPVVAFWHGPTAATSVAVNLTHSAPWVLAAAKKLEELGGLREGWDSYGGLPLKPSARNNAVRAIGCLKKEHLPDPAVVLGSGGTVALEWRADGRGLEIDLGDGEDFEFVKIDSRGNIEEGQSNCITSSTLRQLAHWLIYDWAECPSE